MCGAVRSFHFFMLTYVALTESSVDTACADGSGSCARDTPLVDGLDPASTLLSRGVYNKYQKANLDEDVEAIAGHHEAAEAAQLPENHRGSGNNTSSPVLALTTADNDAGDACDSELGYGFLEALRGNKKSICTPDHATEGVTSTGHVHHLPVSSTAVLYSKSHEPGCGSGNTHVAVLENVQLNMRDPSRGIHLACQDAGLSSIRGFERGEIPVSAVERDKISCEQWVEEDTLFVENPRTEYFQNVYHAAEEVFSAFETAFVLNRHISDFRFLFGWSGQKFFQLESQLEAEVKDQTNPPDGLPQVVELWSHLVAPNTNSERKKMRPLYVSEDASQHVCFKRLVLPMRACDGSILPASWDAHTPCAYGNSLARNVSETILRAFGHQQQNIDSAGNDKLVTLIVRKTSARSMQNMEDVKSALSQLPGATLRVVDLAELSFEQQVNLLQRTKVLVGVHGAGLTQTMLLPPGAGVVEISVDAVPFPGRSVANIFSNIAKWTKHRYKTVHVASGSFQTAVSVNARAVSEAVASLLAL